MQRTALPTRKWANDLFPHPINMQMTYLIFKLPNWYSYDLDWYGIDLIIMQITLV